MQQNNTNVLRIKYVLNDPDELENIKPTWTHNTYLLDLTADTSEKSV